MASLGGEVVSRLRQKLPNADALIFDNYNFLGVGFSANGKSSGVFLSIVLYPRWANLFFFKGALLDDPESLLQGDGKIIRHVRLNTFADFDRIELGPLIAQAAESCEPPLDPSRDGKLKVHAIAERQRSRRPTG